MILEVSAGGNVQTSLLFEAPLFLDFLLHKGSPMQSITEKQS